MYRCLIVDDNEIDRNVLEMHVRKISELGLASVCSSSVQALRFLLNNKVDIVFSDIRMPELSGIELLRSLPNPPLFIFISNYKEYGLDAYSVNAIDYIEKPIVFDRLLKAIQKATDYLKLKAKVKDISSPLKTEEDDYFYFKEPRGISKLKFHDVIYIESNGDFSKIFTGTEQHVVLVSLKNLDLQLPSHHFVRVHKQYIININHIVTLSTNKCYLDCDFSVPITTSSRQYLLENSIGRHTISRFLK
ncbi:two-component system LytT family response regulator [Pedobacter sp. UYP30]|uniref:LytR/AlgR family response regulator transcription factor n=1 Tax=Pedobacter sp. UYP30 TaxID=1756400 RepID=UPI00339B445B